MNEALEQLHEFIQSMDSKGPYIVLMVVGLSAGEFYFARLDVYDTRKFPEDPERATEVWALREDFVSDIQDIGRTISSAVNQAKETFGV